MIRNLINSIWNKEKLPQQWKESLLYLFNLSLTELTVLIIEEYHCYELHTKLYPIFFSQG